MRKGMSRSDVLSGAFIQFDEVSDPNFVDNAPPQVAHPRLAWKPQVGKGQQRHGWVLTRTNPFVAVTAN